MLRDGADTVARGQAPITRYTLPGPPGPPRALSDAPDRVTRRHADAGMGPQAAGQARRRTSTGQHRTARQATLAPGAPAPPWTHDAFGHPGEGPGRAGGNPGVLAQAPHDGPPCCGPWALEDEAYAALLAECGLTATPTEGKWVGEVAARGRMRAPVDDATWARALGNLRAAGLLGSDLSPGFLTIHPYPRPADWLRPVGAAPLAGTMGFLALHDPIGAGRWALDQSLGDEGRACVRASAYASTSPRLRGALQTYWQRHAATYGSAGHDCLWDTAWDVVHGPGLRQFLDHLPQGSLCLIYMHLPERDLRTTAGTRGWQGICGPTASLLFALPATVRHIATIRADLHIHVYVHTVLPIRTGHGRAIRAALGLPTVADLTLDSRHWSILQRPASHLASLPWDPGPLPPARGAPWTDGWHRHPRARDPLPPLPDNWVGGGPDPAATEPAIHARHLLYRTGAPQLVVPLRRIGTEAGHLIPTALRPAWDAVSRGDTTRGQTAHAQLREWLSGDDGAAAGIRQPSPLELAHGLGLGTYAADLSRGLVTAEPAEDRAALAQSIDPAAFDLRAGRALRAALGGASLAAYTAPPVPAWQAALDAATAIAEAGRTPPGALGPHLLRLGLTRNHPGEAADGRQGAG